MIISVVWKGKNHECSSADSKCKPTVNSIEVEYDDAAFDAWPSGRLAGRQFSDGLRFGQRSTPSASGKSDLC